MKKIVTVFAFALICSGAFAQFNQGRMLVGGNVGFSSTTSKTKFNGATTTDSKTTDINFTPQFGYFVVDNLAVGAGIHVGSSTDKPEGSDNKTTSSQFLFVPFVRYYLQPGVFFQGEVGVGGASFKEKSGSQSQTTKRGVFLWDVGVGYAWFLNDHVAIEPLLKYGMTTLKNKDNDAKSIDGAISLNIGFQIYLGQRN